MIGCTACDQRARWGDDRTAGGVARLLCCKTRMWEGGTAGHAPNYEEVVRAKEGTCGFFRGVTGFAVTINRSGAVPR